jgi:hypothetical protein
MNQDGWASRILWFSVLLLVVAVVVALIALSAQPSDAEPTWKPYPVVPYASDLPAMPEVSEAPGIDLCGSTCSIEMPED